MLPSIMQQPFNRTAFPSENKIRQKRGSGFDASNQFHPRNTAHSVAMSDKPPPVIRYSKIQSNMYQSTLTQQIKDIDKKIRQVEKRIQKEKSKQQSEKSTQFVKGATLMNFNGFDFLTNPNIVQDVEEPDISHTERIDPPLQPQIIVTHGEQFIRQNNQYLQKHYTKDLKKKFQRRSKMPHQQCRRKVPKLYITKDNKIEKVGKPETQQQHMFRVLSKEVTPIEIYPSIPNFATVKDSISKNISAYLTDYKPFIQKVAKVSQVV